MRERSKAGGILQEGTHLRKRPQERGHEMLPSKAGGQHTVQRLVGAAHVVQQSYAMGESQRRDKSL